MVVQLHQPQTSSGALPEATRALLADDLPLIVGGGQSVSSLPHVEPQITDPDEPPPGKPKAW